MTELEMIQRAKIYMEKLAMGINPLDDSPVPEEELINNVRLSRCFAFSAQMLGRILQGDFTKQSIKKIPLDIPFEKRKYFKYSDEPIAASVIAQRINALSDVENMYQLAYSDIVTWLMEINLINSVLAPNGKANRFPTPQGMDIGITEESRMGQYGPYQVIVYNKNAQQFILDNLDAIIDIRNTRAIKGKTQWSAEEDQLLRSMYANNVPPTDIAKHLRRSYTSISKRASILNLTIDLPQKQV